ncbi:peroxiredoxin [candidate division KSB1 bacterium]
MKKIIFFVIAISLMASCNQSLNEPAETNPEPEKTVVEDTAVVSDGVFIHISSGPEDPQRVLMGLMMADKMSDDKDVIVYLDIKGVYVVLTDAPDIQFKEFPSSKTILQKLFEKGVVVQVCPGCLKAADKNEEDVMEGVVIADKNLFFNFTEGRILTLDY